MKIVIHIVYFLFAVLFLLFPDVYAQPSADRNALHDLVELRRKKFDAYSYSLEKKSGIFGGQTKNDIRQSNEVLLDLVAIDNRIISLLNRVVDFRKYEKVNNTYDNIQRDEQLENLSRATDTLTKQNDLLAISNATYKKKVRNWRWLSYSLGIALVFLLARNAQRRKLWSDRFQN